MTRRPTSRRRFLAAAAGLAPAVLAAPAILAASAVNAAEAEAIAGDLIVLGLPGRNASDRSAKALAAHLAAGRAGGVLLLRHNVKTRKQIGGFTTAMRAAKGGAFITIDQEGGKVQRLSSPHGFTKLPTAQWISGNISTGEARRLYEKAGREMRALGFNLNLAPSVDIHRPSNPVIGRYGRSFGTDPARIAEFAGAFIDGFGRAGVACAMKHFPGHGSSKSDSHDGFVDITHTWTEAELEPFRALLGKAPMIMGGHLYHSGFVEGREPITFSKKALTGILRNRLGYRGIIITDDLDMAAIRRKYSLKEAVIRSLAAGNDLLLMSNSLKYDPDLAADAVGWIAGAAREGRLSMAALRASRDRVVAVRRQVRF